MNIEKTLVEQLINYLASKPYAEVTQLIQPLVAMVQAESLPKEDVDNKKTK